MTAGWMAGRVLAFDLESTGVSVFNDRIVTGCAAIVGPDGQPEFVRKWLLNPGVDIPAGATEVHGITTGQARAEGMPAEQGVKEIANAIRYAVRSRIVVVAFNAAFDLSMLNAECVRHGLGALAELCDAPVGPVVDPFVIDKAVDRYRPGKRTLGACCDHYGVTLTDAHTADADALAAVAVARNIAARAVMGDEELRRLYADRRYPQNLVRGFGSLARLTVGQLHDAQVQWYREQSESFAQYLRGQANELRHKADVAEGDEARAVAAQELAELEARIDSVRTEWPVCPITEGALL